jgi:hypothetical protein
MRRVLWKKLKWLKCVEDTNEQDLEEVVMETDSICYSQYTIHSNEEVMKYHQEILSIDCLINREIEVEWVCWFDLRCMWFDLIWDSNMWDFRDNTILMEWKKVCWISMRDVSVLSSSTLLMESFQCWVCSTPTLQVWSNSSFSMEICWFLLLFHTIWTLSNLSNVPILLEYYWENYNKNKLRVCNWVSNPICVGSDVIPLNESERCWSDVSWEICDGIVSSCFVQFNSNTLSEGSWHTTEISVPLWIFVLLSERWRRDVNFVIEDGSLFSSKLLDNKSVWSDVKLEIVSFNLLILHSFNSRCWSFVNV